VRARQLRDLSDDELQRKLAETRQELFNLRFQSATGALENPARLRLAKREIARILTIRHERASSLDGASSSRAATGEANRG
jgi:large subunit ribosomal protein L29